MAASRKLRKYRGWIAAGALVIVAAAAFYFFKQSETVEPTTTYTTEAATTGILSVTVSGTGNLAIDGTTDVYSDTAGTVASIAVAEGDSVTTGTVLFTLDADDAEAATARALASYRQAQAGVTQAQASLVKNENSLADLEDRYADQTTSTSATTASATLTDTTSATPSDTSQTESSTQTTTEVTQADIDAAEADVASAEANVNSSKASLSTALIDYEDTQDAESDLSVTAPCSGVVHSLDLEVGDSVSGGSAAASTADAAGASTTGSSASSGAPITLAPEQPLAIALTVNEVDLPTLEIGQRADIEFDAFPDLMATGKVYEIADEGSNDQGVVTFQVRVSIDVADEGLRPGMSAAATIVTEIAKDALLVPNGAVKSNSDGSYYVEILADGETTPTQVTVETGLTNATQTQILSGLSEGDLVVTTTTSSDASSSDSNTDEGGPTEPGGGVMGGVMGGTPPRGFQ